MSAPFTAPAARWSHHMPCLLPRPLKTQGDQRVDRRIDCPNANFQRIEAIEPFDVALPKLVYSFSGRLVIEIGHWLH
jgi:hypothetical protein